MTKTDEKKWDLIVIGGGITGAGILREAQRNGIKTLLLEQNDFAWGTSSRSSKLVHGGLRYLKEGQLKLTYESVREREKLINEAPSLIEPVGFMMPIYEGTKPSKLSISVGLGIYDLMAFKWDHKFIDTKDLGDKAHTLKRDGLKGVFYFEDGRTDDARLVIRLIMEATESFDSVALNYNRVTSIEKKGTGHTVTSFDKESLKETVFHASNVINATGVWSDKLTKLPYKKKHIRPLRGSHIIIPHELIPIDDAIGFSHPDDGRMLFMVPWENVILCGTTDVDHTDDLNMEPSITKDEFDYILKSIIEYFPDVKIGKDDVISTFAGVRPVVSSGGLKPSQESREYILWKRDGITSVTGGKLTTFRKIAIDTLKESGFTLTHNSDPVFTEYKEHFSKNSYNIDDQTWKKLVGKYGVKAHDVVSNKEASLLKYVPETNYIWAEIVYAGENEFVKNLSDLLLRRVRIGNVLKDGGAFHLDYIQSICSEVMPWSEDEWEEEKEKYRKLWRERYSIPEA
jgi:glycerol-3-phosphate dehydrogenase